MLATFSVLFVAVLLTSAAVSVAVILAVAGNELRKLRDAANGK
jgi:hypothetical protein